MKNLLFCLGTHLIATPFVLLCLYALTPWEPYRGYAAYFAGSFSVLLGVICFMAIDLIRGEL
jgi:cytochrome c biogenesis protein CcdA